MKSAILGVLLVVVSVLLVSSCFKHNIDRGPVFGAVEMTLGLPGESNPIKDDLIKRGLFTIPTGNGTSGELNIGEIEKLIKDKVYLIDKDGYLQFGPAYIPTSYPVKTSLEVANRMIGTILPVPAYLPDGLTIQEIYVTSNDTALLIIDDKPSSFSSNATSPDEIASKIKIRIQRWNDFAVGGLKIPGERVQIGDTSGVFMDKDDSYSLLWQPLDTTQKGQFDMAITAAKDMPKDEILKVARSMHQIMLNSN